MEKQPRYNFVKEEVERLENQRAGKLTSDYYDSMNSALGIAHMLTCLSGNDDFDFRDFPRDYLSNAIEHLYSLIEKVDIVCSALMGRDREAERLELVSTLKTMISK